MDVKKIIGEEHTELWYNLCDKIFSNRKEVDFCIYEACEPFSRKCTNKNEVEKTMNKLLLRRKNK